MNKNAILFLFVFAVAACFAQGRRPGGFLDRGKRLNGRGGAATEQAGAANAAAEEAVKNAPRGTNGVPALVFDKAPLELVLKSYADEVQKTIIPATAQLCCTLLNCS